MAIVASYEMLLFFGWFWGAQFWAIKLPFLVTNFQVIKSPHSPSNSQSLARNSRAMSLLPVWQSKSSVLDNLSNWKLPWKTRDICDLQFGNTRCWCLWVGVHVWHLPTEVSHAKPPERAKDHASNIKPKQESSASSWARPDSNLYLQAFQSTNPPQLLWTYGL